MEPKNVDLLVAPSILTEEDKHAISEAIAQYRKTGNIPTGLVSAGPVVLPHILKKGKINHTSKQAPRKKETNV